MSKIENYLPENLTGTKHIKFLSKELLPTGSLVLTEMYPPILILTRPFQRPHFGLSQWVCCGLVDNQEVDVNIHHLSYMQNLNLMIRLNMKPACNVEIKYIVKPNQE